MGQEKLMILEMIQAGKITPAEGMELLGALDEGEQPFSRTGGEGEVPYDRKFLRIRVNGDKVKKVNVNIPLSLVKYGTKLINYGMAFVPAEAHAQMREKGIDLANLDLEELVRLVELDNGGKLMDVDIDDEKEGRMKVEICVD